MTEIKVKTAAMTRVGRLDADFAHLVHACLDDALVSIDDPSAIQAVFVASFAARELCDIDALACVRDDLLARGIRVATLAGPYRTGGEALFRAKAWMEENPGDVLVVGCEKMTHRDAASAAGLLAPRVSDPLETRHGATLPALAALATRAYTSLFRVPESAFDAVAVKNHAHAAHNPLAHFTRAVTMDEVRASPLVADPLRRHHCAPVSDGAAACVLTRGRGDIVIRGAGAGVDAPRFHDRVQPGRFRAAAAAARATFAMAARRPGEINVVEIHDAFAPFELMNLEAMGFFPDGEAWRSLARGDLAVGGRIAVNPSGGMKARGHPIGVCGLTSLAEVLLQLTGRAGARQQAGARLALIQSAGGVARDCYAFVLEAAA